MVLRGRRRPADDGKPFDAAKIDLVSLAPAGDKVRLYIVSDSPWTGSDSQLQSLQEKVHNYVGFALDGQLVQTYPETKGLPWEIVIDCQRGSPDSRSSQVLDRLREGLRRYGGDLQVSSNA
jgi:hypothetical protein